MYDSEITVMWSANASDCVALLQQSADGLDHQLRSCVGDLSDWLSDRPETPDEFYLTGLPALGKGFDQALSSMEVVQVVWPEVTQGGAYAIFRQLGDLLYARVRAAHSQMGSCTSCCTETPQLLAQAVQAFRQLVQLYGRLTVGYDPALLSDFRDSFIRRITSPVTHVGWNARLVALVTATILSDRCVAGFISDDAPHYCHHGPGAVAEKWEPGQKDLGLCGEYLLGASAYVSGMTPLVNPEAPWPPMWHGDSDMSEVGRSTPEDWFPPPSRVAFVPKDYRGPRVIAAEPCKLMWLQQGVSKSMKEWISHHWYGEVYNPSSQEPNRMAALNGSRSEMYATLDLREASDNVRLAHVLEAFEELPLLRALLLAVRNLRVQVDDSVLEPTTYALMGQGTTFVVMSVILGACIISRALERQVIGITRSMSFAGHVRYAAQKLGLLVFGDDVIVRSEYFALAKNALEDAGFPINLGKSCRSHFLESCGCHALFGYDVTTLRPRLLPGSSEGSLSSAIQIAQNFADRGMAASALSMLRYIRTRYNYVVPIVPSGASTCADLLASDLLYGWPGMVPVPASCLRRSSCYTLQVRIKRETTRKVGRPERSAYVQWLDATGHCRASCPPSLCSHRDLALWYRSHDELATTPVSRTGKIRSAWGDVDTRPVCLRD